MFWSTLVNSIYVRSEEQLIFTDYSSVKKLLNEDDKNSDLLAIASFVYNIDKGEILDTRQYYKTNKLYFVIPTLNNPKLHSIFSKLFILNQRIGKGFNIPEIFNFSENSIPTNALPISYKGYNFYHRVKISFPNNFTLYFSNGVSHKLFLNKSEEELLEFYNNIHNQPDNLDALNDLCICHIFGFGCFPNKEHALEIFKQHMNFEEKNKYFLLNYALYSFNKDIDRSKTNIEEIIPIFHYAFNFVETKPMAALELSRFYFQTNMIKSLNYLLDTINIFPDDLKENFNSDLIGDIYYLIGCFIFNGYGNNLPKNISTIYFEKAALLGQSNGIYNWYLSSLLMKEKNDIISKFSAIKDKCDDAETLFLYSLDLESKQRFSLLQNLIINPKNDDPRFYCEIGKLFKKNNSDDEKLSLDYFKKAKEFGYYYLAKNRFHHREKDSSEITTVDLLLKSISNEINIAKCIKLHMRFHKKYNTTRCSRTVLNDYLYYMKV
ncbi:hypothetical protein TRFO_16357 [Tritrichomonas foetus]|uniref:Sel1 repeat family protein n=1 Tax=Tritrichomonas foetus TaxID=1144522 RepID=A0A1J4KUX5_9EUKA|nr:hypothetical protein TRFO_16357 [Tritrichomonas foetus]|eukprot:OHT13486.1 hypothetical protein TRFO_16357 [Tritrichomonas foetus]